MAVQDYKKYRTGLIPKESLCALKLGKISNAEMFQRVNWHSEASNPVPTFLLALQNTENYFVFNFELQRRQGIETWVKQFQKYMISLLPVINSKLKENSITEQLIKDYFTNYVCITISRYEMMLCFVNGKEKGR